MNKIVNIVNSKNHIHVWHQTGGRHFKVEIKHFYRSNNIDAKVEPFICDIASAYSWADLVICRAGASTVAEIEAVGIAAIFIPYPFPPSSPKACDHFLANDTLL